MLTLRNGDVLRLTTTFQHIGAAFTGARVYAALGKRAVLGGFDEKLVGQVNVTGIVNDISWTTYTVEVPIPIANIGTTGFPGGSDYEVYAKLIGIPGGDILWFGPENDIILEAPVSAAAFANLSVTYVKA